MPTYATIERGTTEHLARILEPGKEPYYFVPSGIYAGIPLGPLLLQRAVQRDFPDVQFLNEEVFNLRVEDNESRCSTKEHIDEQ
jgi:hypothetical protein